MLQNRYRILRQIGGGGMGVVYLAEDARLAGRKCAIKEMSPAQLAPQDRNWAINAFRQEAQMLANLSHSGLTAVTDFFPEGGNWYLVMDYVEGKTLEERLEQAQGGRLPLDEAMNIVRQLCNVLEFLHSQRPPVVFRDLKPGNVMLTPQGEVRLIDFGIARFFKPGQTQDTVNLGTPGYAAPELYGGLGQSDPRTDVYGLGALLLRMVTGYDPITAAAPFPLPSPGSLMQGLPSHVEEVISRATRMQPDLRYRSVNELRQALFPPTWVLPPQGAPATRPYVPPTAQPQASSAPGLGKGIWIGLGIAGILFLGLCVAVVVWAVSLTGLFGGGGSVQPTVFYPTRTSVSINTPTPPSITLVATSSATPVPPTATSPSATIIPTSASPRIVYVHGSVGNTNIYVANADGSGRTCIVCNACDEAEPAWSPDGRHIVYQSDCGGSYDIWIVSSSGGNPTQLTRTSGTDEREPDWSPDGSQIVYRASAVRSDRNADGELWMMNANGSNQQRLGGKTILGRSPTWSPDGQKVLFMSEQSGHWQIYVYDLRTGNTARLTNCSTNCRWPCWSPDGQYVAYHSTVSATGNNSATAQTIWIIPAGGGTATQLTTGSHPGRPSWSSNGRIIFNSDHGIEAVAADGSGRQVLLSGSDNWAPDWSE
jgi:serine/threonine-protein kinase